MNKEAAEINDIIRISDEVLSATAEVAASRVAGVASLAGGIADNITKSLLRKDVTKGIRISREEEKNSLIIDIHINVYYGFRIPEVAWEIQENVRNEILNLTGETAKAVNIHVEGVEFTEDKHREGDIADEKK